MNLSSGTMSTHVKLVSDLRSCFPDALVMFVNATGVIHDSYSKYVQKCMPESYRELHRLVMRRQLVPGDCLSWEHCALFGSRLLCAYVLKNHWKARVEPLEIESALKQIFVKLSGSAISCATALVPVPEQAPEGWYTAMIGSVCKGFQNDQRFLSDVLVFNPGSN